MTMAIVAVLYNFGFFTLLAYTPFPLGLGIHQLGFVFFGWGLLLALTSVFAAQPLERRFGLVTTLAVALAAVSADLLIGGLFLHVQTVLILVVILSGAFLGIVNTVLTEAVMASASVERPIASSAYSFVRFTGGAIAPFLAGKMAEHISPELPMLVGAAMVSASVVVLLVKRSVLAERARVVAIPARPRQDSNLRPAA
jgi:ACDE family multidrug resistance protein